MHDGKQVSVSRDTQDVSFPEGVQMLEIFRDFKE